MNCCWLQATDAMNFLNLGFSPISTTLEKLNFLPHPLVALHIPIRRNEECDPIDPFAHPADGDRQMKVFKYEINIYRIKRYSEELSNEVSLAVPGADNSI